MSAHQPQHSKYGFSKTLDVPYEEAVEKARGALKEEGFGVLCEIDIKEKLKEKLGVNFIVYEADEAGKSVVAAIDAKMMLSVVGDNATLDAIATDVNEKLKRVVARL